MLRPNYFAAAPSASPSPYENPVGEGLLRVSSENQSHQILMSCRPPPDKRYSGIDKTEDLESHLNQLELVTSRGQVPDLMKYLELRHWFTGPALNVCKLYESEIDPALAYKKAKAHLLRDYGARNNSAQKMLDEILKGSQVPRNDTTALQNLIISLEKTYRKAVDTGRHQTFDSADTINHLMRKRVGFLIPRWAAKCGKVIHKWEPDQGEKPPEFPFKKFVNFLKQQNTIAMYQHSIGREERDSGSGKRAGLAAAQAEVAEDEYLDDDDIDYFGVDIHATNSSRPKTKPPFPKAKNRNFGGRNPNGPTNRNNGSTAPKGDTGTAETGWSCFTCDRKFAHPLERCDNFLKKSDKERFQVIRTNGICILCLEKGHLARECPSSEKCSTCEGAHHTVMHREGWGPRPT